MVKEFFVNYRETESNDFVMRDGKVELLDSDMSDWTITLVDTGLESPIGERLRRVRKYLGDDEYFLANYADVLTDAPLDTMIERFHASEARGIDARCAPAVVLPLRRCQLRRRRQGNRPDRQVPHLGERRLLRARARTSST